MMESLTATGRKINGYSESDSNCPDVSGHNY